mgnify:CR=1 FL=1
MPLGGLLRAIARQAFLARCISDPQCLNRFASILVAQGVPPSEAQDIVLQALMAFAAGDRPAALAVLQVRLAELRARGVLR